MGAEKSHSPQVRDPGKLVGQFQTGSENLRTRRIDGVSSSPMSQFENKQRKQISSYSVFCCIQASSDCMRLTHIGKAICFTQTTIQILISSRNAFTDRTRIIFDQILGTPCPSKLTHKSNHHNYRVPVSETQENVRTKGAFTYSDFNLRAKGKGCAFLEKVSLAHSTVPGT